MDESENISTAAQPPLARLSELCGQWLKNLNLSRLSVDIYASAVKQFLVWLEENELEKISRKDILRYKRYLEESSKKPATIKLYIIAVRQFFKWLDVKNVYENVAQDVNLPKVEELSKRECLTPEQVKAVLGKIPRDSEAGLRDYAVLLLMVACGLRRIEICRADVEDLRTGADAARLYIQGKGETEKNDYVELPRPVEQAVLDYLSERNRNRRPPPLGGSRPAAAAPLFTSVSNNSAGKRVSVRGVTDIVKERLAAAGFKNDRQCTHCLRQTAVSLAILAGRPLQEVRQFARHTTIATTMLYAQDINKKKSSECAQAIAGAIL